MSRLTRLESAAGPRLRRVNWAGGARVVVAGGAAAALVQLAAANPLEIDVVAAAGEQEAPVVGTSLATRVTRICPGNELTGIPGLPDVRVAGSLTAAAGPADLLPVPATGAGRLLLGEVASPLVSVTDRPGAGTAALPADGAVRLTGEDALAPAAAGTQEWRLAEVDLRGLATTPCGAAASDLWLLGGGDGPGRQERLVLANPGDNPVTADVTIHGAAGPIGEPVVETVPPGGRVSRLLDARAGAEERPAVHVRAGGGGLYATLTDTWTLGSTALGAETVAPAAAPTTVQVVPGAVFASGPVSLRVAVPGEADAVVRVSVLGRDGLVPLTGESVVSVASGAVGDLSLEGAPPGTYAVVVSSDVPVAAAVLSRVGDGSVPGELAWSVAAEEIRSVGGAALPTLAGASRTLHLASSGGPVSAEVATVVDGEPRTRRVDLLSNRVATVPLDAAASVWVRRFSGNGALRGTVVSSAGEGAEQMLSSMPLQETPVTSLVSRAFPLP